MQPETHDQRTCSSQQGCGLAKARLQRRDPVSTHRYTVDRGRRAARPTARHPHCHPGEGHRSVGTETMRQCWLGKNGRQGGLASAVALLHTRLTARSILSAPPCWRVAPQGHAAVCRPSPVLGGPVCPCFAPEGFRGWCGGPWRHLAFCLLRCSCCRLRARVVLCLSHSSSFETTILRKRRLVTPILHWP